MRGWRSQMNGQDGGSRVAGWRICFARTLGREAKAGHRHRRGGSCILIPACMCGSRHCTDANAQLQLRPWGSGSLYCTSAVIEESTAPARQRWGQPISLWAYPLGSSWSALSESHGGVLAIFGRGAKYWPPICTSYGGILAMSRLRVSNIDLSFSPQFAGMKIRTNPDEIKFGYHFYRILVWIRIRIWMFWIRIRKWMCRIQMFIRMFTWFGR